MPFAQPDEPTWYYLTVTDAACVGTDSVFVDVATTPYAYPIMPEPCGGITSCNPQQFQFVANDSGGIIDADAFIVEIDEIIYDTSSSVFSYAESILTIVPPTPAVHGDTVRVRLISVSYTHLTLPTN